MSEDEVVDLQIRVMDYLLEGGVERRNALRHLIGRDFFGSPHTPSRSLESARTVLQQFVNDMVDNYCVEGINRFCEEFDLQSPEREVEVYVKLRLNLNTKISNDSEVIDLVHNVIASRLEGMGQMLTANPDRRTTVIDAIINDVDMYN